MPVTLQLVSERGVVGLNTRCCTNPSKSARRAKASEAGKLRAAVGCETKRRGEIVCACPRALGSLKLPMLARTSRRWRGRGVTVRVNVKGPLRGNLTYMYIYKGIYMIYPWMWTYGVSSVYARFDAVVCAMLVRLHNVPTSMWELEGVPILPTMESSTMIPLPFPPLPPSFPLLEPLPCSFLLCSTTSQSLATLLEGQGGI